MPVNEDLFVYPQTPAPMLWAGFAAAMQEVESRGLFDLQDEASEQALQELARQFVELSD